METELLFIVALDNAMLNPWVYTLQSTGFRRAVKDSCFKICRGNFATCISNSNCPFLAHPTGISA